jgi:hypothetical protein
MTIGTFFDQAGGLLSLFASTAHDIEYTAAREPGLLLIAGGLLVVLSLALMKIR